MQDNDTQDMAELRALAEGFREQSYLWRMLSLIQTPVTMVAIVAAMILYVTADTIVHVDPKPSPGYYFTSQVPNKEFVMYALEFANLISTYNSQTAEQQFEHASKFLGGQLYLDFREDRLNKANPMSVINTILRTDVTQVYFIDKFFIRVDRINRDNPADNQVKVRFYGVYTKYLKGNNRPTRLEAVLYVTMQTTPNTIFNRNGIVVTDFEFREQEGTKNLRATLEKMDRDEIISIKESGGRRKANFVKFSWDGVR